MSSLAREMPISRVKRCVPPAPWNPIKRLHLHSHVHRVNLFCYLVLLQVLFRLGRPLLQKLHAAVKSVHLTLLCCIHVEMSFIFTNLLRGNRMQARAPSRLLCFVLYISLLFLFLFLFSFLDIVCLFYLEQHHQWQQWLARGCATRRRKPCGSWTRTAQPRLCAFVIALSSQLLCSNNSNNKINVKILNYKANGITYCFLPAQNTPGTALLMTRQRACLLFLKSFTNSSIYTMRDVIRCVYIDLHYCSLITEIVILNYLLKHLFRYRVLATRSVQLHFDNAFLWHK